MHLSAHGGATGSNLDYNFAGAFGFAHSEVASVLACRWTGMTGAATVDLNDFAQQSSGAARDLAVKFQIDESRCHHLRRGVQIADQLVFCDG